MESEFRKIIQALRGTNEAGEALGAPDGIIDASSIIDHLKYLTKDGRPLKSDEQSAFTTWLGDWLQNQFGGGAAADLCNCIVAQSMLLILTFREIQKLKPDVSPEEILMEVCNQDVLSKLAKDMEATAYRLDESGDIAIDYFGHEVFHAPFVIDALVKHNFIRRKITRSFYMEDTEPEFICEVLDDIESANPKDADRSASRKVNLNDFENLTADSMNGFDEFYEQFWEGDFPLIELGIEFDDLPPFRNPE
jgi:hypothetical protein